MPFHLAQRPYRFDILGSATFTSAQIGTSFKAMHVRLNATVAQGDQLGFYISETSLVPTAGSTITGLVPYCHLEYNKGAPNGSPTPEGQVVLQQGAGQNSLRGLQMNLSPVLERSGRGVKFFTAVS